MRHRIERVSGKVPVKRLLIDGQERSGPIWARCQGWSDGFAVIATVDARLRKESWFDRHRMIVGNSEAAVLSGGTYIVDEDHADSVC